MWSEHTELFNYFLIGCNEIKETPSCFHLIMGLYNIDLIIQELYLICNVMV
jgi:hypothetical protein